jgi:hypothetical protein
VSAAFRDPSDPALLLAAGSRTPPFRHREGTWRAEPLTNRGAQVMSRSGPIPALAVGRHVYVRDKGGWTRHTSAGGPVVALWAASRTSMLIATPQGLARLSGKRLSPVKTPLGPDDALTALHGASPDQVFGRSSSGAWIRVGKTGSAAALAPTPELAGFEEQAAGIAPDRALILAGTVPGDGGARRAVLVRSDGGRLLRWEDPRPLADGDRFTVIWSHAPSGELLVATSAGSVRVRGRDGSWKTGQVSGELASGRSAPARRSAAPAPAR